MGIEAIRVAFVNRGVGDHDTVDERLEELIKALAVFRGTFSTLKPTN